MAVKQHLLDANSRETSSKKNTRRKKNKKENKVF
jgi:hypothetical protein